MVDYDMITEKGASGSPIWTGPFVPGTPDVPACGIVIGGITRHHTFSLEFDPRKLAFATR